MKKKRDWKKARKIIEGVMQNAIKQDKYWKKKAKQEEQKEKRQLLPEFPESEDEWKECLNNEIDGTENVIAKSFLLGRKEGMKDAIRNELVFLQSIDKSMQKFHTPQYCAICQRMIKLRKVMEQ